MSWTEPMSGPNAIRLAAEDLIAECADISCRMRVGSALRAVYRDVADEAVPPEIQGTLDKLDRASRRPRSFRKGRR